MKKTARVILSLILTLALGFTLLIPACAADLPEAETKAAALKQLRLFKGGSGGFELDRAPSRTEALVLLIRVLGQESEALNGSFTHPFTDVAPWADKYIGYAYEKGLTKGISATQFGTGDADSGTYLTYMLRALGYSDSAGDFSWDAPDALAASVGLLPSGVDTANFLRADTVLVSWAALEAKLKDGSQTLSQKLMDMKVFTSPEYDTVKLFVAQAGGTSVSTSAELQAALDNKDITVIRIASDMDITGAPFIDREAGPAALIYIKEGVTLTVSGEFITLGCFFTNDGTIAVTGTFDRGMSSLTNNGTIAVKDGGTFTSGMTDTYNYGAVYVDGGGELLIERGTQFFNSGSIASGGYINIDNGGCLFNGSGRIENNGSIDLASYFEGDLSSITGTGTINDTRQ